MKSMVFKDYENSGQTMESFVEEINKITEHTTTIKTYPANMRFLSFKEKREELINDNKDIKRSYVFYLIDKITMERQVRQNIGLPEVPITTTLVNRKENDNSKFLDQIAEDTGLMIEIMNEKGKSYYYGLSEYALPTVAAKAGLKGDRIKENSLFRDLYLANGLINPNVKENQTEAEKKRVSKILSEGLTLTLRKTRPQKKDERNTPIGTGVILSGFSGNFKEREANIFLDIIKALERKRMCGKIEIKKWESYQNYLVATFRLTELTNKLKKKYKIEENISAEIEIRDSDCGLSSLTVQGLVNIDGESTIVGAGNVKERNGIELSINDFTKEIKNNINTEIEEIFKRISKLNKEKIPENNRENFVEEIVDKAIDSMPSVIKTLGKKRIELIQDMISGEENTQLGTIYDIIKCFLSFPLYINKYEEIEELGPTAYNMWIQENGMSIKTEYK